MTTPKRPRYIETLPRRGYRFIARIETVPEGAETVTDTAQAPPAVVVGPDTSKTIPLSEPKATPKTDIVVVAFILVVVAAALYWFLRPRTPVVGAIHQLTHSGRQKILGGGSGPFMGVHPQTDGTRIYFQEFGEGKWQLAQVSTKGGEVSYFRTPLIGFPWIADSSKDGSTRLLGDFESHNFDVPFWVLLLPDESARRIPGRSCGCGICQRRIRLFTSNPQISNRCPHPISMGATPVPSCRFRVNSAHTSLCHSTGSALALQPPMANRGKAIWTGAVCTGSCLNSLLPHVAGIGAATTRSLCSPARTSGIDYAASTVSFNPIALATAARVERRGLPLGESAR